MKRIICYSGGHSSALVAIEVSRKFGNDNLILLNHDINPRVEDPDIKRFKQQVAEHIGVPITYANHPEVETKDQFDVCLDRKGFHSGNHQIFCTFQLKTQPFKKWCNSNLSKGDATIYYGFDANERHRIQRRAGIIGLMGFKSDFPLALWERTIFSTNEIGILPPLTYALFKHGNCTACLKAGRQHWYIVFLTRKDLWEKGKATEDEIGHSIIKGVYLDELEPLFLEMEAAGIRTTEHEHGTTFFARAKKYLKNIPAEESKPCECAEG